MATKGKKLSDAYIELRADDSKLSGDVKVKAAKVGREFGSQLNRALSALNLDPVDVKADPKTALAAIETTRERLREMSRDAESVEMRVRTERALTQLERFRRQLGAVGDQTVEVKVDPSPAQRQVEQLRRQLTALGLDPVELDADPKAAVAAIKRVDEELRRLSGDAATVHVRVDAENARASLARFRSLLGDVGGESATGFATQFGAKVGPLMARLPLSPHLAAAVGVAAAAAAPGIASVLSAAVVGGAGAGGIIGGLTIASKHPAVQASAKNTGDLFSRALERAGVSFVPATLDALSQVRREIPEIEDDLERALSRASQFVGPLTGDFLSGAKRGVEGFATAVERAGPVVDVLGNIAERAGDVAGDTFENLSEHAVEAGHALATLWTIFEFGIRSVAGTIEMLTVAYGWLEKFGAVLTGDTEALGRMVAEQEAAKGSSGGLSEGLQDLVNSFTGTGTSAATATTEIRNWLEVLREGTGQNADWRAATRDMEQAIDDATAALKENGRTIDDNTPKGRANNAVLDKLAATTNKVYDSTIKQTGSQEQASAAAERGRAKFIALAEKMGYTKEQAVALAGRLIAIPNVSRTVDVKTAKAQAAIAAVQQSLGKIKDIHRGIYYTVKGDLKLPGGTSIKGAAAGGPVDGRGPKGVDSEPYLLAPGEHIFTAAEVDRMGGQTAVAAFRRQLMVPSGPSLAGSQSTGSAAGRALVMDSGGMIMPGWNPPIFNGTGRPEAVTTAASMDAVVARLDRLTEAVERRLIAAVERVAPGVGREIHGIGPAAVMAGRAA